MNNYEYPIQGKPFLLQDHYLSILRMSSVKLSVRDALAHSDRHLFVPVNTIEGVDGITKKCGICINGYTVLKRIN